MKIKILIYLLLFFIGTLCVAQDSLISKEENVLVRSSINPKDRSLQLKELAYEKKDNEPLEAMKLARESLALARKINFDQGKADAFHVIGLVYMNLGQYQEGLQNLLDALKIREQLGDEIDLARSYNNIGQILVLQGNLEEALDYYQRSLEYRHRKNDSVGVLYSLISIGETFQKKSDYKQALRHFNQAMKLARLKEQIQGQALVYTKKGELFEAQGAIEPALNNLNEALGIYLELDSKPKIAENYNSIAEIHLNLNDPEKAILLLEDAIEVATESSSKENEKKAYLLLSRAFYMKQNYEKAYDFQRKYTRLKDSLLNQNKIDAIASIKAEYDLEKKESELKNLESQDKISRLRNFTFLGIIIGVLLLGVFGILYIRYRFQTRTNELLSDQKNQIETKNKELELSNVELEDFAHAVSHDLKQPLRTIGSYTGVIKHKYGEILGNEAKEYMAFVNSGVHQMHVLLSDLLIYSRIGHNDEAQERVDMNQLLAGVISNLQGQILEEGADVKIGSLPPVFGNQSGLIQLFQNLISNALKFSGEKKPLIQISHRRVEGDHQFLIKDNGIGIKAEYQQQIFNAFQRLHTQEEYPGTGIGLAICQKVVQQHDGKIWVESVEGKGSSFYISFPA